MWGVTCDNSKSLGRARAFCLGGACLQLETRSRGVRWYAYAPCACMRMGANGVGMGHLPGQGEWAQAVKAVTAGGAPYLCGPSPCPARALTAPYPAPHIHMPSHPPHAQGPSPATPHRQAPSKSKSNSSAHPLPRQPTHPSSLPGDTSRAQRCCDRGIYLEHAHHVAEVNHVEGVVQLLGRDVLQGLRLDALRAACSRAERAARTVR